MRKASASSPSLIGPSACERNLLGGDCAARPLNCWYWSLEDPAGEIDRRLPAVLLHYEIDFEDICGRLFVNSEEELVIGEKTRDVTIVRLVVAHALMSGTNMLGIDAVVVDPFVSCHRVPENDNGGMDVVAKAWARIARDAECAIELVHHVRSRRTDSPSSASTMDAARWH
ncbi:AAA family ATPase [Methylocella sp.]|uniref:AAA family ATPase n=1 Tax=Methylocella sp. TaxID=1978226 RepID=UPI003C1F2FE9